MIVADIVRDVPNGEGMAGISVNITPPNSTTILATVKTTDGTGTLGGATTETRTFPGYPKGYWEYRTSGDEYGGLAWWYTVNDQTRHGSSHPTGPSRFSQMGEFHHLLKIFGKGLVEGGAVSAVGTRQLRVTPLVAVGAGLVYRSYANETTASQAAAAAARIDALVVRFYPDGSALTPNGRSFLTIVTGVAGSGQAPVLRDDADAVDVAIAYGTISGAGATSYSNIQQALITPFPVLNQPISDDAFRGWAAGSGTITTSPTNVIIKSSGVLAAGVTYSIRVWSSVLLFCGATGVEPQQAPFATYNGVTYEGQYQGHADAGRWNPIPSSLKRTVVGTGAAIVFGCRVRRAAGSGTHVYRTATATLEAYPTR